ncbi:lycopene cyclase family protein [Demequina salsinemoris]|uniref:lycopene cyclase family protein n=1 Tax=Demequina salsinemoris TaxID=577470 RepID=UPI0007826A75|nr:lycopene cyclase family protein [Demequina salsinemoris]
MDARLLQADAVIVGAGAAGLSLLAHLGRAGWRGTVAVVDDGSTPVVDRSWAWWSTGEGILDAHAIATHGRALVAGEGWSRELDLAPYAYRTITGEALRAAATEPGTSVHAVEWIAGTATDVRAHREGAEVEVRLPDGARVLARAPAVFDSVGLGSAEHAWGPRLDFLGWQVRADHDLFTPGTLTFMDFRTAQDGGVAFVYVLPTSARTALVERTAYVMDRDAPRPDHEPHLLWYLDEVLDARRTERTEVERGVIPLGDPMGRRPQTADRFGVVPIGIPAGAAKASTGYAFARIQAHSARIAAALVADDAGSTGAARAAGAGRGGDVLGVPGPASSRWYAGLDHALLTALREDPSGGRRVLEALLRRATPEQLLRFLDEDLPLRDQAALGARLPFGVFPRAYLRALVGARRRG